MPNNALTQTQLNRYVQLMGAGGVPTEALLVSLDAAALAYTPNDDLSWPIPAPNDVAEALDEVSNLERMGVANFSGLSGASPVSVSAPNALVPVKSGRYLIFGAGGGLLNAGAQCSLVLTVDGVNVPSTTVQTQPSAAALFSLATFALVNVNRASSHSVGGSLSFGAASISAGYIRLVWYEA